MAVMILFLVNGSAVQLIVSMIIGAILLPTAIWVIMSIYHKIGGKKA